MTGQVAVEPTKRKRAWRSCWRRISRNQMGSVVLSMLIALGILLGYVGMYAKVTKNGYCRSRLSVQVRETRVENQRLRADIQMLSSPDRLAQIAVRAGMQFSGEFDYVRPRPTVVVAEAGRD